MKHPSLSPPGNPPGPRRARGRLSPLWLGVAALVAGWAGSSAAYGELTSAEWKQVTTEADELFAQAGNPEEKKTLISKIAAGGKPRAWKLLGDLLEQETAVVWQLQADVQRLTGEYAEVMNVWFRLAGTPEDERRVQSLQKQLEEKGAALVREREALDALIGTLQKGPPAVLKVMLRRAKTSKSWAYRAAAVRIAAARMEAKEAIKHVQHVFYREEDRRVRSAALEVLGLQKEGWEDLALGRLEDPDWGIQLQAARLLRERGTPAKVVPSLVAVLPSATPRVAEVIAEALRHLTGAPIEADAQAWNRWLADNQEKFAQGQLPAPAAKEKGPLAVTQFYGLTIRSERIIFVIDVSNSMSTPASKTFQDPPKPVRPGEVTGEEEGGELPPPPTELFAGPKIDVCRYELRRALHKLPETALFNVIAFNNAAMSWKNEMMPATRAHKVDALAWAQTLKASGSTYIDGALRVAFKIAGLLNADSAYPQLLADTIVLLSDGAPTNNDPDNPQNMDPEIILKHVREWNRDRRIVLHCVGVDTLAWIPLLEQLAAENGGTYVAH